MFPFICCKIIAGKDWNEWDNLHENEWNRWIIKLRLVNINKMVICTVVIFILILLPPWDFDLVFFPSGSKFTLLYFISVWRMQSTWNLVQILSTLRSFKKSEKKNLLALQIFADVSIFNKNTAFFVFCLCYCIFCMISCQEQLKCQGNTI